MNRNPGKYYRIKKKMIVDLFDSYGYGSFLFGALTMSLIWFLMDGSFVLAAIDVIIAIGLACLAIHSRSTAIKELEEIIPKDQL